MRFLVALTLALALARPADAGFVLRAADVTAPPGGTGTLLVTLTNDGPTDLALSGYQIQLTTDVAGFRFTGVDRTPGYVFPGTTGPLSSDFAPPLLVSPVTRFTATDFSANPLGYDTVGAGQTVSLMAVSYAVDPGAAPGTGFIRFVSPGAGAADLTHLADGSGNLAAFAAVDGRVTITPAPPGLVLVLTAGAALGLCRRARHRPTAG
ncbi:MAG: hypothetical protein K2V38_23145 [Gemmataceae bacterium]|nr:hypothetical protein [Gemmataceae bacterium]